MELLWYMMLLMVTALFMSRIGYMRQSKTVMLSAEYQVCLDDCNVHELCRAEGVHVFMQMIILSISSEN